MVSAAQAGEVARRKPSQKEIHLRKNKAKANAMIIQSIFDFTKSCVKCFILAVTLSIDV